MLVRQATPLAMQQRKFKPIWRAQTQNKPPKTNAPAALLRVVLRAAIKSTQTQRKLDMRLRFTVLILGAACLAPIAQAQPARIDYSKPGPGWQDQSGALSQQTGYDGNRPYQGSLAERRADGRDDRYNDRQDNRRDDRLDRREQDLRQDRAQFNQDRRQWRDNRRRAQWDQNLHNGYYNNRNQWRYGQPNDWQMRQRGFAMGYRPWTRGQSLGMYNDRFAELNYRERNLRAPPRGYRWVQDDRGDYLLAAIIGGLIAQVIINSPR
jgi:Ni/Co efflux regulator RcnB